MDIFISQSQLRKVSIVILCISIFLSFSMYFIYIPISIYLPVSIILTVFLLVLDLKKIVNSLLNFHLIILIFYIVLIISYFYSSSYTYGSEKLQVIVSWGFLYILNLNGISRNPVFFLKSLFVSCSLFLLLLLIKFGNPQDLVATVLTSGYRIGEETKDELISLNPIWIGRVLGLLILLTWILFKNRLILYSITIISSLFIFASGSRGVIIALFVVFYLFIKDIRLKYLFLIGFIIIGIFIFYLVDIENEYLTDRISLSNKSSSQRVDLITDNFYYFSELRIFDLFFGYGLGSTGIILSGNDVRNYPHNIFVEVFSDTGIFGVLILSVLVYQPFRSFSFSNSIFGLKGFFLIYLFFFINSMFSGDLISNNILLLFLILSTKSTLL